MESLSQTLTRISLADVCFQDLSESVLKALLDNDIA